MHASYFVCSSLKRKGRRAVLKAVGGFAQADLCTSNRFRDFDEENSRSFLIPLSPPTPRTMLMPREQVCEVFSLAILQLKVKKPLGNVLCGLVLHRITCLEVSPGKLSSLFLFCFFKLSLWKISCLVSFCGMTHQQQEWQKRSFLQLNYC